MRAAGEQKVVNFTTVPHSEEAEEETAEEGTAEGGNEGAEVAAEE